MAAQDTEQQLLNLAMRDPTGFWRGVSSLQQLGQGYASAGGTTGSGTAIAAMAGSKPRIAGGGTRTGTRGRPRGSGAKRGRKSATSNTATTGGVLSGGGT